MDYCTSLCCLHHPKSKKTDKLLKMLHQEQALQNHLLMENAALRRVAKAVTARLRDVTASAKENHTHLSQSQEELEHLDEKRLVLENQALRRALKKLHMRLKSNTQNTHVNKQGKEVHVVEQKNVGLSQQVTHTNVNTQDVAAAEQRIKLLSQELSQETGLRDHLLAENAALHNVIKKLHARLKPEASRPAKDIIVAAQEKSDKLTKELSKEEKEREHLLAQNDALHKELRKLHARLRSQSSSTNPIMRHFAIALENKYTRALSSAGHREEQLVLENKSLRRMVRKLRMRLQFNKQRTSREH